jgi:hypothetical protein
MPQLLVTSAPLLSFRRFSHIGKSALFVSVLEFAMCSFSHHPDALWNDTAVTSTSLTFRIFLSVESFFVRQEDGYEID